MRQVDRYEARSGDNLGPVPSRNFDRGKLQLERVLAMKGETAIEGRLRVDVQIYPG